MNGIGGSPIAQAVGLGQGPEAPEVGGEKVTPTNLPHPFSHSLIEHHDDGSHTMHHIHRQHGHVHSQPHQEGDVRGTASDHEGMLDHVMDHTGIEAE